MDRVGRTASPLGLPQGDLDHVVRSVGDWEALRGQRLLLTGGTGFMGKWLLGSFLHANRFHGLDARVVVLSRDVQAFRRRHADVADAPEIEWLQGNVRDFQLSSASACSHAIHAATDVVAQRAPSAIFEDCVSGTRQVLQQLQSADSPGRLLLLSSGAVYGRTPGDLDRIPESWPGAPDCLDAASAYGEGKRASELLCAMAAKEHGWCIPVARCFAFVGPHLPLDKHFAIGNFIGAALRGEPIRIQGDGTPLRSYLHAADMSAWLWTLLLRGQGARAYNVGGDESVSIAQLAHRVVDALGSRSAVHLARQPVAGATIQKYVPALERVRDELKLRVTIDLDEAIRRTAAWAMENPA